MKIGGGNYEQEETEEARRQASNVIFQKMKEGQAMNEGRMVEAETRQPVQGSLSNPRESINLLDRKFDEQEAPKTKESVPAPSKESPDSCSSTSHRWSEPTVAPITVQRTSVICKECDLVLTTEKQGSPSEVMADLLRQIPH